LKQLQPRRTALAAWLALLALSTILGAASYGVPPHKPASPETGALQQGTEPQARKGMSGSDVPSASFESSAELEGSARTSPRGQEGAGAFTADIAIRVRDSATATLVDVSEAGRMTVYCAAIWEASPEGADRAFVLGLREVCGASRRTLAGDLTPDQMERFHVGRLWVPVTSTRSAQVWARR
jgi:hypothetical protein